VLVGRDLVLASAIAALDDARRGCGRLLLLAGEAGIGKTTIARAITTRAVEDGAAARWGACWESAALVPFAVWADCLRGPAGDACAVIARHIDDGDFDPGADAPDAARRRLRWFSSAIDALRETAHERPQVLVLEDLHWADEHSLELLRSVASHLPSMPVLVVATYRDDEFDAAQLKVGGAGETITLDGLGETDVGMLLGELLGRPATDSEVHTVFARTGGNPLFVTHVGRLVASGSPTVLPGGVREVLARRLARLSPDCVVVLGAAAVLGTEFDVRTVSAMLGQAEDAVTDAFVEAEVARLITREPARPGAWAFAHSLISEACADATGARERRELHRRAIDARFGAPGVAAGSLVHHVTHGRFDAGDARPATIMTEASREALVRFAWPEAIRLAQLALDLAPLGTEGAPVRAEAWLALGAARLRAGDDDGTADAFTAAADIGRAQRDSDLLARAALGFAAGLGGFEVRVFDERQLRSLEAAASALPPDAPLRPLVLARLSVALSFVGSDERRRTLADEAVELARVRDDHRALAVALAARCDALAGPAFVTERLRASSEIVTLARRADDRALELLGRRLRVVALLETGDYSAVDAEITTYERVAARLADPFYGWYVPLWRATRAYASGRLDEARDLVRHARELGAAASSINASMLATVHEMLVALDTRSPDEIERLWQAFGSIDQFSEPSMLVFRALLDARTGKTGAARRALERLGADVLARLPQDQEWLASAGQLVEAAVAVGFDALVRASYAALVPYEDLVSFEGIVAFDHGAVGQFLALAAGHLDDNEAALRHTERALERVPDAGAVVVAHTRANCARGLLATTDDAARNRGRVLARDAMETYSVIGLSALADEMRVLVDTAPRVDVTAPTLGREGDTWVFTYAGTTSRLRHAKGIADLAALLARPGREIHVRALEGVADMPVGSAQSLLDDVAVAEYRDRLADLEADLAEADRDGDAGRSATLGAERDALVEQLTAALGLGDRRRGFVDADERLRKAVSARVKASIDRIAATDPALGRHLRHSVRTGYFCVYEPEEPVRWEVRGHASA
jgi:tetratricopeptide (TPR) repeat protein